MFMKQNRRNFGSHNSTKSSNVLLIKIGRSNGKNITKFLRAYLFETKLRRV